MDAVPLGRRLLSDPHVVDTGLPVEAIVPELRAALAGARHAVLHAPPGAGKTTVVPLRLLDEPWLAGGKIVMLEPRRLATRAAARRMAALLGGEVGETVGYVTRDDRAVSRRTRIEVVTEGILTRRLQSDPSLPGVGLVIFDEIHERNLQADLALAFVLDVRSSLRPDVRLLAMSATLEVDRLRALLGGAGDPAPVVASEGRTHPIEVRWRPVDAGPRTGRDTVERATAAVVHEALRDPGVDGDVLVFLPGAAEIRRVGDALRGSVPATVDVRPLYGALPLVEQDVALAPSPAGRRRVVLSTDIAETSLTVAGVHVVVDAGLARGPRYDARTGLTRLHTSTASRSSADQRAGRAGRTGPGVAYRLWSESDHATRARFAPAEILTVDLAGLLLDVTIWGTTADALPFLDAPPVRALEEAAALLTQLGAIDGSGRPTAIGRAMAELPLHPRLAHLVIAGHELGHGTLACALAALLEDRDLLRGRPDELPVDVTDRVRLIVEPSARHPLASGHAVSAAQRRARDIARRAGIPRVDRGAAVDLRRCGLVLALAYPDRVAQRRGPGRFRMRSGGGASLATGDALAGEGFVVVADLTSATAGPGGDARIRLAAGLDAHDVEVATSADEEEAATLGWDRGRNDLRLTVETRVGALVLRSSTGPATPGPATVDALVEQVRATRLGALRWTDAARTLQVRAAFVHRTSGPPWPDLSDDGLLATLDEWLAPLLVAATGRRDLEQVDVLRALRGRLGHRLAAELDRVAPASLTLASGRVVPVDYTGDAPTAAVRVQDLFGTTVHPTVGAARVPVVLQLLSPAGRPLQITADLPGFWAGSWAEVRKEMAGRYPKHAWPTDPATAPPVRLPRNQRR